MIQRNYTLVKGNIDGGISRDLLGYLLKDIEREVKRYGYVNVTLTVGGNTAKPKPKRKTYTQKTIDAICGYKQESEMTKTQLKRKQVMATILA